MPADPVLADPRSAEARALLDAARAYYHAILPSTLEFVLAPEALAAPGISFYLLREGGRACAALARREGYGELKALWVDPAVRGQGLARRMVTHVETVARNEGLPLLRLETDIHLTPAIALYQSLGYHPCPRFGSYPDSGQSVFLERHLA